MLNIHIYMYTCIHIYMYTCIHVYMYTYIHIYIHIYAYIYSYIHTPTYIYIPQVFESEAKLAEAVSLYVLAPVPRVSPPGLHVFPPGLRMSPNARHRHCLGDQTYARPARVMMRDTPCYACVHVHGACVQGRRQVPV